ncbi:glutathione S-transferase-like [Ptychodera flava]|uniref:glutathione S-transferase-like n=1 Tax=Ptychodera flava TaxID=63121 RepID=UPI00396A14B9
MPQSIKLTYFPLPGRAEAARLCFSHAGVDFEDKRVTFEEWGAMKAAMAGDDGPLFKLDSLPWLEVDGDEISQSMAITRYAASVTGLDGKTSIEKAKVDMILSAHEDLNDSSGKLIGVSPEKKEEVVAEVLETFKKNLEPLEKMLNENNGGKAWIVGDSVTVADLAIFGFLQQADMSLMMAQCGKELASELDIPGLLALKQRVAAIEQLQDYFKKSGEIMQKFMEAAGSS